MTNSILETIRPLCNVDRDNDEFDEELIPIANGVFATLTHLGVGPKEGFRITCSTDEWGKLTTDAVMLGFVRQYVPMKTRMIFDPPSSSSVLSAYEKTIQELEWRIIEHNEGR